MFIAAVKGAHNIQSLTIAKETVKESLKSGVEKLYRQSSRFCKMEKEVLKGQEQLKMECEKLVSDAQTESERKVSLL